MLEYHFKWQLSEPNSMSIHIVCINEWIALSLIQYRYVTFFPLSSAVVLSCECVCVFFHSLLSLSHVLINNESNNRNPINKMTIIKKEIYIYRYLFDKEIETESESKLKRTGVQTYHRRPTEIIPESNIINIVGNEKKRLSMAWCAHSFLFFTAQYTWHMRAWVSELVCVFWWCDTALFFSPLYAIKCSW